MRLVDIGVVLPTAWKRQDQPAVRNTVAHVSAPTPLAPLGTENAAKSERKRSRRPAATR